MKLANNLPGGLLLGLILPALALFVCYLFLKTDQDFRGFLAEYQRVRLLSPLLSLSALLNLGAFYFFLQKNWYKTVQGVISATLLYAILIIYLKFVL